MRFKAFTIVELTVGLLISSIVIAMTTLGFVQMKKLHNKFENDSIKQARYSRLHFLLTRDLARSARLQESERGYVLECLGERSNTGEERGEVISYQFADKFVIREQKEWNDTFQFKEVNYITKKVGLESNLIGVLKVNLDKEQWTFLKKYPSDILMVENSIRGN